LSYLAERDSERRAAQRLDERRVLGVKITELIYDRRVFFLSLCGYLTHLLGRDAPGLLRRNLLLTPAAALRREVGASR
jgi:hypothetical protein